MIPSVAFELLSCVEIEPRGAVRSAIIWLHGLGADGHDFEPIVPYLGLPEEAGVRFVFPHAPMRAVTINMGLIMRAWYDIHEADLGSDRDEKGMRESADQVLALVRRENDRGIGSGRIVLAGFSQGGAVALHVGLRHAEPLAGIAALSCYLAEGEAIEKEASAAGRRQRIFQAHGTDDPIVPFEYGAAARDRLAALGCEVEWRTYRMGHQVADEEIADLGAWLGGVLRD
jgi:phospholipase/carboxylesterase